MKRLSRILSLARGQQCIHCGAWDDTTVSAHMPYAGVADAGVGAKCHDLWIAHLCADCHNQADHGQYRRDLEWRVRMVYLTQHRLIKQGYLR